VRDGFVSGWAYCPAAPEWRVWVQVLLDDHQACGAWAELEHPLLAMAGIGDGFHGFRVAIPIGQDGRGSGRLRVEAGGGVPLPPDPNLHTALGELAYVFEVSAALCR
jgi:hypothetical protein